MIQGDAESGFTPIEVELVDETLEAWIDSRALNPIRQQVPSSREEVNEPPEQKVLKPKHTGDAPQRRKKPKKRSVVVPEDEGLLFERRQSFYYGIFAGTNLGILQVQTDVSVYTGMGLHLGGFGGIYITRDIPLRIELGYTKLGGSATATTTGGGDVGFGLFDIAANVGYRIERFEVYGGLQYSAGISVGQFPTILNAQIPNGASDASTLFFLAGGGVRFDLGEVNNLMLGLRYGYGFQGNPIALQSLSLLVHLEFAG